MADTTVTKKSIAPALLRGLRAAVAIALPIFISWLANNPDAKWAALAPVIMAIGKYLRDNYKWEWLPV